MKRERIIVGLSGGVDSSVAALLLKRAGHEVVGVFMKNWEDDDTDEHCTSREDLVNAAAVADVLGIELEAVNFAEDYRQRVIEERPELDLAVAKHVRIRRAAGGVLAQEVREHPLAIFGGEVDRLELDADHVGNGSGID